MKKTINPSILPWLTLVCGGLGLALRLWMYSAVDKKGMIPQNHIAGILIWVLTALALAALIFLTRDLTQANKYRFNFPASVAGGAGAALGALGFAVVSVTELFAAGADRFTAVMALTGLLATLALVFVALCRFRGQHPNLLMHLVVTVYLMLRLIWLYRSWSADPQLQDYCFQLLAVVCLMLASFHRACFDANEGVRKRYVLFALAAVYFCCLSLKGWGNVAFFLGSGAWMLTNLCSLKPMPREDSAARPNKEEQA